MSASWKQVTNNKKRQNQNQNQQTQVSSNIRDFFDENCPHHYMYGCKKNGCTKKHETDELHKKIKELLKEPVAKIDTIQIEKIYSHLRNKFGGVKLMTCVNFLSRTYCKNCNEGRFERIEVNLDNREFLLLVCYQEDKRRNGKMCYMHIDFNFDYQNGKLKINNFSSDSENIPRERNIENDSEEEFPPLSSNPKGENCERKFFSLPLDSKSDNGEGNNSISISEGSKLDFSHIVEYSFSKYPTLNDLIWAFKTDSIEMEKITEDLIRELITKYINLRDTRDDVMYIYLCGKGILSQNNMEKERRKQYNRQ